MKSFSVAILTVLLCTCAVASAQPRAIGIRPGATGFDISYQHSTGTKDFAQLDLSSDFGYGSNGAAGFKATATYNFVFARPAWTEKGSWAMFAGPGVSLGYVQDRVTYRDGNRRYHPLDYGFMLSLAAQAGLEYTFWFPLQIAVDIRPYFGMHINDGVTRYVDRDTQIVLYEGKAGYYDNGWLGFAPTLSFRYRF